MMSEPNYVRWFKDIRLEDGPIVGARNAWLGELYSVLSSEAVRVPDGFALTAQSYRDALTAADAWGRLNTLFKGLACDEGLAERAAAARQLIYDATSGEDLRKQIALAYRKLEADYGAGVAVAVRSSAPAEDLPIAGFDGLFDSFINVRGESDVIEACRRSFASLFTDRGIVYRLENGLDQFKADAFGRRHENGALRHRVERGRLSRSTPSPGSATSSSLPAPMAQARTRRTRSPIPTRSTFISPPSEKASGPC